MRKNQCGNAPNDERYTPANVVKRVRRVLGGIDVDPASCDAAQAAIQAATWYCRERSGLAAQWPGRVWLNPPYSHGLYGSFVRHLIREILAGRTTEAICLVNNNTETAPTQALMEISSAWCFPRGRVAFRGDDLDGKTGGFCGQLLCYFGPRPEAFISEFSAMGACAKPVHLPQWDLFLSPE